MNRAMAERIENVMGVIEKDIVEEFVLTAKINRLIDKRDALRIQANLTGVGMQNYIAIQKLIDALYEKRIELEEAIYQGKVDKI